ncbi:MAG: PIN domain-containing protein [Candidatus Accumulibacter sp.]|nr:PIN domain-containing protein [Accumulibacter sp.]
MSGIAEKVLIDTNVVLDYLLDRQPFVEAASELFARIEAEEIVGALAATTVTTIHYFLRKAVGASMALDYVGALLERFDVAAVDGAVLHKARSSGFSDYEDAVLHAAALHSACQAIVTRNGADFRKAKLPAYAPEEFLAVLQTRRPDTRGTDTP